jgi:hypothetical protein
MDFLAIAQTHHEIRGPSEAGVMKLIDHLDDLDVELNVSGGATPNVKMAEFVDLRIQNGDFP